jgi:diguanylate cyclase (GGDEF)-like protein
MTTFPVHYIEIPGLKIKFRRPSWPVSALIVFFLVSIVSVVDYLAGPEPEFSIFYLIPITAAVFLGGWPGGLAACLLSAAAWFAADFPYGIKGGTWFAFIWDDVVQLGFFLLHTFIINWLLRTLREVRTLSLRDPLTGAANWRYFEEQAETLFKLARRNRSPVTFAYIDLDNFKKLNDSLGHQVGNEVLQTVAASIQSEIRPSDLLARLGGDEFGLLLDGAQSDEIHLVLARVMSETCRRLRERNWTVTLSLGAVTYRRPPDTVDVLIREADKLMYRVKRSGKNEMAYAERA